MNRNSHYNDELPHKKTNKAQPQRKQKKTDSQTQSPDRFALFLSSVGNQQIAQLFGGGQIQAKLDISTPGDKYEQQADNMADQMMKMNPGSVSLKTNIDTVQTKGGNGGDVPSTTEKDIKNISGKGNSLSKPVREFFEPRLGVDLGNVKVHTGSKANALARSVNARAFTYQNEIVFGKGEYQPGTTEGKKLIGHELVHTVQQNSGLQRKLDGVLQCEHDVTTTRGVNEDTRSRSAATQGEIVIMSGGPTSHLKDPDHDANPVNFLTTARVRIENYIQSAFGNRSLMTPQDRIVWVIMRPPYIYRAEEDGKPGNEYLDLIHARMPRLQSFWDSMKEGSEAASDSSISTGEAAISVHFVDTEEAFINFMNQGSASVDGERALPVKRFEYFGHGAPGQLMFMHNWDHKVRQGSGDVAFSTGDISKLDPDAFAEDAEFRSWACNTATPMGSTSGWTFGRGTLGKGARFSEEWVKRLGGRAVAPFGRTSYNNAHEGRVELAEEDYYGGSTPYWVTSEAKDFGKSKTSKYVPVQHPVIEETTIKQTVSKEPPGTGSYKIEDMEIKVPTRVDISPDTNDPAWQGILQELGQRAYAETFETDDIPNTLYSAFHDVGNSVSAHSQGFRIETAVRNNVKYWRVKGSSGSIRSGWYLMDDFVPSTQSARELSRMMNPGVALRSGALSKSNAILTVAGTTLDYAIDPAKEFGSDYFVDVGFDLAKAAGSSAVGSCIGAATTSWLAGGALGASIGSAAPVVGTIVGFVVGILVAMAIEYFIEDYRAALKSYFNRQTGDTWIPFWEMGGSK
ncbi:MAG: DUF4157 domain-containing protein [Spirochaetales bacterium]|nr:DUF4157 domain-containing protein [Spirochaetales bacterium]